MDDTAPQGIARHVPEPATTYRPVSAASVSRPVEMTYDLEDTQPLNPYRPERLY